MPAKESIAPPRVSRQFVESKCDYFSVIHLWPREAKVNPASWLSNFTESEMDHAVHLLNAFLYFSADLTAEMFKAAFHSLSARLVGALMSRDEARTRWREFRESLIVTRVTGEIPNDTDSGYTFARMARQHLDLDESRIMSNRQAIQQILEYGPCPVVFVDDFVGSGDQFIATWERDITTEAGTFSSFKSLSSIPGSIFCYCPIFVAETGKAAITRECQNVLMAPAHFLPANYSALADDSIVWPDHLRSTALDFLESSSKRAGIEEWEWKGYRDQGLTLAFEHGVPDATLPLFYHHENAWKPLIRRT
jgi:hypothetical protein